MVVRTWHTVLARCTLPILPARFVLFTLLLLIIKLIGWLVAHSPEFVLRWIAATLGDGIFLFLRRRRRLILSNLHHAFPEKPAAWHRRIGRESCRRMIETGLLSLATPFLDEARLRKIVTASPELVAMLQAHQAAPRATVYAVPHLAYWEVQTCLPLAASPTPVPEIGIIYRPLDNPAADAFVKRARERFGLRPLSRRDGFAESLKILRRQGIVAVLFDQNAGLQGALTLLLDRVCSTTELPGLMADKFDANVFAVFARRRSFWRVDMACETVPRGETRGNLPITLNLWLERLLRAEENMCASWLWAHARWRNQDMPAFRFRLEAKRNLLADDLAARGLSTPPRRTRIWIRMPNWLGDVVMALPLIRALRVSRPDAEITLVAKKHFLPLLQSWDVADRLYALPAEGLGYWQHFRRLRAEHIDVWLLFTNSVRGDLEAWLSGSRQRFGILRPGKRRPLLTHAFRVAPEFREAEHHQLELWNAFFQHFGLKAPADRTPVGTALAPSANLSAAVGLISGSENTPEKRWPIEHWRALIEAFPEQRFVLFGTIKDSAIAAQVAAGFDSTRVQDRTGKTDLLAFSAELSATRLLVTNDTGGMHLANAVGVPLIALFGPTNPVRTGPVFAGRAQILQPPGCASTGGGRLEQLEPSVVIEAVRTELTRSSMESATTASQS